MSSEENSLQNRYTIFRNQQTNETYSVIEADIMECEDGILYFRRFDLNENSWETVAIFKEWNFVEKIENP